MAETRVSGGKQHSAESVEETVGKTIKEGVRCDISERVQCLLVYSDNIIWKEALSRNDDNLNWELHKLKEDILCLLAEFLEPVLNVLIF
ncbi:hypothetical protein FRX31_005290 [Thalictrum thalictroides]|uniref:Uncharacterized protein n=1 Tax=Thalictrum thalictroides TaxID=46969 RepID=A0A7J6X6T9_THATH|nr:hypothetical protein FRX31_005290 [Thalictrum thalictroides]